MQSAKNDSSVQRALLVYDNGTFMENQQSSENSDISRLDMSDADVSNLQNSHLYVSHLDISDLGASHLKCTLDILDPNVSQLYISIRDVSWRETSRGEIIHSARVRWMSVSQRPCPKRPVIWTNMAERSWYETSRIGKSNAKCCNI